MQDLKKEHQSLAITDLQLLVALFMRNNVDLTEHMKQDHEGYLIEWVPTETGLIIEKGIKLVAKFDKDGMTKFLKFDKSD